MWMLRLFNRRQPSRKKVKRDDQELSVNLPENIARVHERLDHSFDLVVREVLLGGDSDSRVSILYIDGLAETRTINEHIISPVLAASEHAGCSGKRCISALHDEILTIGGLTYAHSLPELVESILAGETVVLADGADVALIAATPGWKSRAVSEPSAEIVIRGPRQGFVETLQTNIAMLRRVIPTPDCVVEALSIGASIPRKICIAYLSSVVSKELVEEVKTRLAQVSIDVVLESGYIEQYIEDSQLTIFPTINTTERPDTLAARMLEGRVAIFTEGTPVVMTVPMLLVEVFQTPDDYYLRPFFGTLLRWIRYFAFLLSILSPSLYVAFVSYHQELIPTDLLVTIAAAREGTPFPAALEAFVMGLIFEVLKEAGIRMPRSVGQAVSIVGALVIGQAAISSGLVGAPMVMVVAITAISSFIVPTLSEVGIILRFYLLILGSTFGAVGIMIGLLAVMVHMASLQSFGAPYISPIAPLSTADLKDVLMRAPWWLLRSRPEVLTKNRHRQRQVVSHPNGIVRRARRGGKKT